MLTQERLKEVLSYDPETGVFIWNEREDKPGVGGKSWNSQKAGKEAKCTNVRGYVQITINKKNYLGHRLVWFYVHGEWPQKELDHINSIKTDNRICNLRLATRSENGQNQKKAMITNKSTGLLGAYKMSKSPGFYSIIKTNNKPKYLGVFDTPEQAHKAYIKAKRQYHPFGEL